jgi:hypothetical protein
LSVAASNASAKFYLSAGSLCILLAEMSVIVPFEVFSANIGYVSQALPDLADLEIQLCSTKQRFSSWRAVEINMLQPPAPILLDQVPNTSFLHVDSKINNNIKYWS